MVKLSDLIAEAYHEVHNYILNNKYTHYWFPGGRGSGKSTVVSLEIVYGIMRDASQGKITHAVVYRKVAQTLSTSVIPQIEWAINTLGVAHLWNIPKRDRVFTYLPTGQTIRFEGTDDPAKQKGTKVAKGYFKYIWYEELDQFSNMNEINTINQSILRGVDDDVVVFYTYNPPESIQNWVNAEVKIEHDEKYVLHTTYLDLPKEWLGEIFINEAETMRKTHPRKYLHQYMGVVTGTGGEVFRNLEQRRITNNEIKKFDNIKLAVDFGFSVDPLAFVALHYDSKRRIVYIFDEIYGTHMSNSSFVEKFNRKGFESSRVVSDVEPRTVNELRKLGVRVDQARKGPGSREAGFKFLKDMNKIIIDPNRCPNTAKEFREFEYLRNRAGEYIEGYPTTGDDAIDAVRYALEDDMWRTFEWG